MSHHTEPERRKLPDPDSEHARLWAEYLALKADLAEQRRLYNATLCRVLSYQPVGSRALE